MTTRITQNSVGMRIAAGVFIGLCFNECLASETCKNNSGSTKHVCVVWDRQAAPIEGTDFQVDYACGGCSDDPAVDLTVGDEHWVVYSEVISSGVAANIGALTTTDDDNYVVKIANGANAGAANVGSMLLLPGGGASSSIASGSSISGDLTGNLTVQKSSGGSGGSVSFSVGGDVDGDMTIPIVSSLTINGDLTSTGSITVSDGLAVSQIITVLGETTGSISFNSNDIAGTVNLYGGGDGTVTGRDVLSGGLVDLGVDTTTFTGTATFRNVASGGTIRTAVADLSGAIYLTGDLAGSVTVVDDLLSTGLIQVAGDTTGFLTVGGNVAGTPGAEGNPRES